MADVDQAPGGRDPSTLKADGIGHVLLVGLRAGGGVTGLIGLGWPAAPSKRPR